jgi:hypothetical protein
VPLSICNATLRGASHNGRRVKRTMDKLSSRGQGRSSLKYTNCGPYISLERKVCLFKESLDFHQCCRHTFFLQTNSWRQNYQKVLSRKNFGGHCLLASSVKAEQTIFCSPPIKLLESFVISNDARSVTRP